MSTQTQKRGRAESPKPTATETTSDESKTAGKNITIDEHGLPRLPDGRRSVELIHAPAVLEHASHIMPWVCLVAYFMYSAAFKTFTIWNIVIHLAVFIPSCHLPAITSGKMSWIDLSWPLGLLVLGLQVWFFGTGNFLRRFIVGFEYFIIGGRMTVMVLAWWKIITKGSELTRYQYRRLLWEEKPFFGGLVTNTAVSMQLEICEQWVWNVTWLALPAMLHAFDTAPLGAIEILGHAIWALSFACEFMADKQKFDFVTKCAKEGTEARLRRKGGKVCTDGLWRFTRHPNYYMQWQGWVGITISSIPALLRFQANVSALVGGLFAVMLVYVPVGSYLMMVYYTGSIPAEVYTVQTRTEYVDYQKTTNMFFPGPPRALAKKNE